MNNFDSFAGSTLNVGSGTVDILGSNATLHPGSSTTVANGSVLSFTGSTVTLQDNTQLMGSGETRIVSGNLYVKGSVNSTNLVLGNGTYYGTTDADTTPAAFTGTVKWRGGAINNYLQLAPGSTLSTQAYVSGDANKVLAGTLDNSGTIRLKDDGFYLNFGVGTGGSLINQASGVIDLAGDTFISSSTVDIYRTPSSLINHGLITKSAGSGISVINVSSFSNDGTIRVISGNVIQITSKFTNLGRIEGVGTIYTPELDNVAVIAPGADIGNLAIDGILNLSESSSLEFDLQSNASFDFLSVSGSFTLGGSLRIKCLAGCTLPSGTTTITLMHSGGNLAGSFSSFTWAGFDGYDLALTIDPSTHDVLLNLSAVPEPSSYALFLAGGLSLWLRVRRRKSIWQVPNPLIHPLKIPAFAYRTNVSCTLGH